MLSAIKGFFTSSLTGYMTIAIVVLAGALAGATYLSYKFYGDKQVAEQENTRLSTVVEQEKDNTQKAVESSEIINDAVSSVREGERQLQEASEKIQNDIASNSINNASVSSENRPEQPSNSTSMNTQVNAERTAQEPTAMENAYDKTNSSCSAQFISDYDIRMLRQAHCLTDGDASDCD
jgi:hypothetical protein